jgi:putative endopeptidase
MKLSNYLWLALPAMLAVGCTNSSDAPKRTVFFDKTGMDTTVSPGDNFFQYASGAWIKKTEIPASETGWGSFYTLDDDNTKNLHKILEETSAKTHDAGSLEQKVGDLYASGMDTAGIDKLGYSPIKPLLAKINGVTDYKGLLNLAAGSFKDGDGFLFGFYVAPDDKNSTQNMAQMGQSGITLPNCEYYTKTDTASVKIRAEYVKYIAKLFTLIGVDAVTAAKKAADVLKLETEIAKSHSTPVQLRDPQANYHKFAVTDFQKQVPDIDLKNVFSLMGVKTDTILVGQPKYYVALGQLLKSQPIDVWKSDLEYNTLNSSASVI